MLQGGGFVTHLHAPCVTRVQLPFLWCTVILSVSVSALGRGGGTGNPVGPCGAAPCPLATGDTPGART